MRGRLHETLRRDAPRRKRRLRELGVVEPWLMEVWEAANTGEPPVRGA
jgi:hypothetical protein